MYVQGMQSLKHSPSRKAHN